MMRQMAYLEVSKLPPLAQEKGRRHAGTCLVTVFAIPTVTDFSRKSAIAAEDTVVATIKVATTVATTTMADVPMIDTIIDITTAMSTAEAIGTAIATIVVVLTVATMTTADVTMNALELTAVEVTAAMIVTAATETEVTDAAVAISVEDSDPNTDGVAGSDKDSETIATTCKTTLLLAGTKTTLHDLEGICIQNITRKVREYVEWCPDCQENRTDRSRRYGELLPINSKAQPYHTVAWDFVVALPNNSLCYPNSH
ncbi:hypothetical protein F4677DRAFT_288296 [Hypoxylon crocopeplum]|nr:hypothetical protein F4677DRAFT_288296 [Hypoxylon crocopeplum]